MGGILNRSKTSVSSFTDESQDDHSQGGVVGNDNAVSNDLSNIRGGEGGVQINSLDGGAIEGAFNAIADVVGSVLSLGDDTSRRAFDFGSDVANDAFLAVDDTTRRAFDFSSESVSDAFSIVDDAFLAVDDTTRRAFDFSSESVSDAFSAIDDSARRTFDISELIVDSNTSLTESNQAFLGETFSTVLNMVGDQSRLASQTTTGIALEAVELARDSSVAGDRSITNNLIFAAAAVSGAMLLFGAFKK